MKFKAAAALLSLSALAVLAWLFWPAGSPQQVPLWQVQAPAWTAALGGEGKLSSRELATLDSYSFNLPEEDIPVVKGVAAAAVLSELTDKPYGDPEFDAPVQPVVSQRTPRCKDTTLLAASPVGVVYDGQLWAKTVVAFSGNCVDGKYTRQAPGVVYSYARLEDGQWRPARSWQTPLAGGSEDVLATDPAALIPVSCQGQEYPFTARPKVVAAFQALCQSAAEADVPVTVTSAFRTAQEQQELYEQAVSTYGADAQQWVSFSDGQVCASRHCQGLAVGVEPTDRLRAWLQAPAGCLSPQGAFLRTDSCTASDTAVSNAEKFGFATPPDQLPGYLEYSLPAGLGPNFTTEANCFPYGMSPSATIAAVFRCRLSQAGVPYDRIQETVRTALAVADCSSGLNPQATVFSGAWATTPKPGTDRTFPLGGLFGLAPSSWASGDLGDPVAAANYAAKLWLANQSFSQFFCATGLDKDLALDGVDPAFNDQSRLPAWTEGW